MRGRGKESTGGYGGTDTGGSLPKPLRTGPATGDYSLALQIVQG